MSDRTLTEIEFEYVGGGYFREKGVAVGDKAVIAHAPELVTAYRTREMELEREVERLRGKLEEIQEEVGDAHYADDVDLGRVRRALRAALSPPKETP